MSAVTGKQTGRSEGSTRELQVGASLQVRGLVPPQPLKAGEVETI